VTDDQQAFIDKIIENPGDDLARLVYADWLDEHDISESWRRCSCSMYGRDGWVFGLKDWERCTACNGTGKQGHQANGNAERAEFIRLQIDTYHDARLITRRELDLGHQYREKWFLADERKKFTIVSTKIEDGFFVAVRRGFIHTVSSTYDDLLDYLPRVAREHPIEVVNPLGVGPHQMNSLSRRGERDLWYWVSRTYPGDERLVNDVGPRLHNLLDGFEPGSGAADKLYRSQQAAYDALSRAFLKWARLPNRTICKHCYGLGIQSVVTLPPLDYSRYILTSGRATPPEPSVTATGHVTYRPCEYCRG
jgi:uncharacterized protein (TIGR02996 family)